MGENLSLMQALYITISSMLMVFLILLLISGVLSLFKYIFKNESGVKTPPINNRCNGNIKHTEDNVVDSFDIDEEEKIVVALAASIMLGDGIPNPNLHIKRITRIS
ncbi:MAG: OadG family protein [Romboutsia sp.]|nr:OadG family protein [Romboutsia sp.]